MIVMTFGMLTLASAQSDNTTWTITRLNIKQQLTSIVYLLKVCNYNKQTPIAEFRAFWNGPFARNLSKCTLGNIGFNPDNNIIVEMYIPCQFVSVLDGKIVDNTLFDGGQNTNYYNIEWAHYVVKNTKFNTTMYRYRMLVLPKETPAKFYGLGTLGCYADGCYSWYNTNQYVSNLFLHELGHNFGLDHSRSKHAEYGDFTCVMGNEQNRCWNAAHRYVLGWSEPRNTLFLNNSQNLVRSSFMLSVNEFIRVNNNIFVEHVNLSSVPNIVPQSIQVYQLTINQSTIHLCSLLKVGDVCTIDQDMSIYLSIDSITNDKIIFNICPDACQNISSKSNTRISESRRTSMIMQSSVMYGIAVFALLVMSFVML
jgi:hypothetical protein